MAHQNRGEGERREEAYQGSSQNCGYPSWPIINSFGKPRVDREESAKKQNNIAMPYLAGFSEKLRKIFHKHIPVHCKPSNTLRKKHFHLKDKTPRLKQSNIVSAVHCSEECPDLYSGETKQPLHNLMAGHRRANNTKVLAREDSWFERWVKEAIYVKLERP